MNCKYCDSPTCEADRYPDDSRVLRECRHRVQLERDFFRNRLSRYETVKPAPGNPPHTCGHIGPNGNHPLYHCGTCEAKGCKACEPQPAPQEPSWFSGSDVCQGCGKRLAEHVQYRDAKPPRCPDP